MAAKVAYVMVSRNTSCKSELRQSDAGTNKLIGFLFIYIRCQESYYETSD